LTYDFQIPDLLYFQHRLGLVGQVDAPASVAFDLARSPQDPATLDTTAQQFGSPISKYSNGWGLSSFLTHLTATQPDTVKAPALGELQDRLKSQGFLDPSYNSTGTWDATSNAAFDQFERQQTADMYAGNHLGATTTQRALAALGWMLPSQVFQGIVGAAKGFVLQAPETAERVGALGGAASGAVIGAAVGSIIPGAGTLAGAGIGAGIGAAVGFFGDLLTQDQGEGDQSALQAVWDAVTPYEEYSGEGGAQRFFEDLGWVATAASLITGVGGAVRAGAAGLAGISGAAAAEGTSFAEVGLTKAISGQVGWSSKLISNVTRLASADRGAQTLEFFKTQGLIAQASRPLISKVITPVFTGVSSAQVGARIASSVGSGETETTIEKAIREAPQLKSGIELPFLGDIIDLPAFIIQPTQFLPWKLGDLARGMTSLAHADMSFEPLVNIVRAADPLLSRESAFAQVKSLLGDTAAEQSSALMQLHLEHGIESMAYKKALASGIDPADRELFLAAVDGAKNDIRETILTETNAVATTAGDVNSSSLLRSAGTELEANRTLSQATGKPSLLKNLDSTAVGATEAPTLREAMSYAFNDPLALDKVRGPASFEAYVQRLTDNGSGLDGIKNYFEATKITRGYTAGVRDGSLTALGTDGKLMNPGTLRTGSKTELTAAQAEIKQLEKQLAQLREVTDAHTYAPEAVATQTQAIRDLEAGIKTAKQRLKALRTTKPANWDDRIVVPERMDTPTKWDYLEKSRYMGQLKAAMEVSLENGNITAYGHLKQLHMQFLETNQDLIPGKLLEQAKKASKPTDAISAYFEKMMRSAPEEIRLSDQTTGLSVVGAPGESQLQDLMNLGYKSVVRHSRNTFEYATDPRILEATGINDYTRRATFFDSIGLGVSKNSDYAIARLRSEATVKLVDELSASRGWGLNGKNILSRLHRGLAEVNHTGTLTNEAVRGLGDFGKDVSIKSGFIIGPKGLRHLAVDIRDLRADDVFEAMRDIRNFTHQDAVALFGAIQKGGAFGAEVNFLKSPIAATHELGRVMRVSGLQGFTDIARSWHLQSPGAELSGTASLKSYGKRAAIGAAVGGASGYVFGDEDKLGAAIHGAEVGLAVGIGVEMLGKRTYGYLPNTLHKFAMALRYSLSPSFDVRRFVKQNLLAATTHDLPPLMNGPRYVKNNEWESIFTKGKTVTGEEAWGEAKRLWNRVNGVNYTESLDTFDRTLYAAGITGYNPMNRQMAHAYALARRGYSDAKIGAALKDIYAYGIGRSGMEKSINYVFFPFSFEKKLVTTLGDFILQNPARSLLLYEGARRFYQSTWATDVQDFLHDHVPFLEQLKEFNAFSHGLAPGRFLYQGVNEHRTNTGKAAQMLASVFIPGGASVEPIQQAVGGLGDLAVHAFAPVVVTGESITRMGGNLDAENGGLKQLMDLAGQYIPFINDLNDLYDRAIDQAIALTHGESKWSQLRDYYDSKDICGSKLEPLAQAMGYSTTQGFLGSTAGAPWAAAAELQQAELDKKYPDAAAMTTQITNSSKIRDMALNDILSSQDTSAAYTAIRQIVATEKMWDLIAATSPDTASVFQSIASGQIRALAEANAGDSRFAGLWDQLYKDTYGPVRMVA